MLRILLNEKRHSKVILDNKSAKAVREEMRKQLKIQKTYKLAKLFSLFNVIDKDGVDGLITFEKTGHCYPITLETLAKENSIMVKIKIGNEYKRCFFVDVMKIGIVDDCYFDVITPGDPLIEYVNKQAIREFLDNIFGIGSFEYYRYDIKL